MQPRAPSSPLEPSAIAPMKCSPAAGECWRRACSSALFHPGRTGTAGVGGIGPVEDEDEDEVSYEELELIMAARAGDKKKGGGCTP